MVERPSIPEIIQKSAIELLQTKRIDEMTVTQISRNCGITTRTFYNHFKDKNDVVSSIYTGRMRKHMGCSIPEWYGHMSVLFTEMPSFFEHALCYVGQNSLSETIIALEWEKLTPHIKQTVRQDPDELLKTQIAIEYMLYGNLGTLMNNYVYKKPAFTDEKMLDVYSNSWNYMVSNIPPLVLKNLNMEMI